MNRTLTILILILQFISIFNSCVVSDSNKTIYVDDDNIDGPWDGSLTNPFKSIQNAIENSNQGDTIFVFNGIYYDNFTINRSIYIIGENNEFTIIDGMGNIAPITILSSNVFINNFTIRNSAYGGFSQGIYIGNRKKDEWFEGICISNCIIHQCGKGIFAKNVKYVSISQCHIFENMASSIYFWTSNQININNCTIEKNGYNSEEQEAVMIQKNLKSGGIHFYPLDGLCNDITIEFCLIQNNIGNGIDLDRSYNCKINNNTIRNNTWYGIDICNVTNISIEKNNIELNQNDGLKAILMKNSTIDQNFLNKNENNGIWINGEECNIVANYITNNKLQGICAVSSINFNGTYETKIYNNHITNNDLGISIYGYNSDIWMNQIEKNNIGIYISTRSMKGFKWIHHNNIIDCKAPATFYLNWGIIPYEKFQKFEYNYWGRPYLLPKMIFGECNNNRIIPIGIDFDCYPAYKPYIIEGLD